MFFCYWPLKPDLLVDALRSLLKIPKSWEEYFELQTSSVLVDLSYLSNLEKLSA